MATESGKLNIEVPNFSKIIIDAIKDALIAGFHKMPYSDTPYYLYGLYALGGLIILIILFWFWSNFIR
jgi:hypothetical protein